MVTQQCPINGETKESLAVARTNQGLEIQAPLIHLTRYQAVFELPGTVSPLLRLSESLDDFRILAGGRTVYRGRAIIRSLVNRDSGLVCQVGLDEFWLEPDAAAAGVSPGSAGGIKAFFKEWQKTHHIRPEFKVAVSDLQTFLYELRLWLGQLEWTLPMTGQDERESAGRDLCGQIGPSILPVLSGLFENFENALIDVEDEVQPMHHAFGRRQLHPLLLCSPFFHRVFSKPLGHAGDYEMVNMIVRDPLEGGSLYAKLLNHWFLNQAPAQAHRNRINYLTGRLVEESARFDGLRSGLRVLNLGCGPAHELQRFLHESPPPHHAAFTLLDFNTETLTHARTVLEKVGRANHCHPALNFEKRSVHQLIKESAQTHPPPGQEKYDLIYCAGLFDYLTDAVCHKLNNFCYNQLNPGGILITTNVEGGNPRRLTMDYLMDWPLNYRTGREFAALRPELAPEESCRLQTDDTGVNLYFEARKPHRV